MLLVIRQEGDGKEAEAETEKLGKVAFEREVCVLENFPLSY